MRHIKLIIVILIAIPLVIWGIAAVINNSKPKPTITKIDKVNGPALRYSEERAAFKEEILSENYQLSQQDQKVVSVLKNAIQPMMKSSNVVITYDKTKDEFVAEVTTIRIEPAKREAISWFKDQGLSDEAICILPINFTIDEKSTKELHGFGIIFDPLPSECR